MFDVVALGESLIDFTPAGQNNAQAPLYAQNPGGAPANVLAMNARLGGKTAFIGKVGDDALGRFLHKTMVESGIDCSGLRLDKSIRTTLAFVQLDEVGDRSFTFYRKPGADMMLDWSEVDCKLLEQCHIFHFGSVSMTDDPSRTATLRAVQYAKQNGALISYDPNDRPMLWSNRDEALKIMTKPLHLTDILKVSLEEMKLLTGKTDVEAGSKKLLDQGISLIVVTLGPDGAYYRTRQSSGSFAAYPVKTIDTTGAGDAFAGSLHYQLAGLSVTDIDNLSDSDWSDIMRFCNAAASLTTSASGAIPAMPDLEQINACINSRGGG